MEPSALQVSSIRSKVLLQWLRQLSTPFRSLSSNISREISLYLSVSFLIPSVKDSTLRVYDLESRLVKEGQLVRSFSTASAPCLIASDVVMYMGGLPPYTPEAFAVNLVSFHVTELPQMKEARGWPGAILYANSVYVFGGNIELLLSVEKYSIRANRWTSMPNMIEGRFSFTPCLYKEEIYLADGNSGRRIIEAFDPHKEIYRQLSVRLPPLGTHSVSFILNDDFYFISYQFSLGRLRLKPLAAAFSTGHVSNDETSTPYSGCPPLVYGAYVYYANYIEGTLTRFDVKRARLESFYDFSTITSY